MKIVLTKVAQTRLEDIYSYYKHEVSPRVAKSVKGKIIDGIRRLKTYPELGNEEDYLSYLKRGYRKLIVGNYKIIYRILENEIVIDTIFDSRQEPDEMKKDIKTRKF